MMDQPKVRTVIFERATRIDGAVVEPGTERTFPNAFAHELVSARKARFKPAPPPKKAGGASSNAADAA